MTAVAEEAWCLVQRSEKHQSKGRADSRVMVSSWCSAGAGQPTPSVCMNKVVPSLDDTTLLPAAPHIQDKDWGLKGTGD